MCYHLSMELTAMDYVRSALANGILEDMELDDLMECAIHAQSVEAFEEAVNILAQTQPASCNNVAVVIL